MYIRLKNGAINLIAPFINEEGIMAKQISDKIFTDILQIIKEFPYGCCLKNIKQALNPAVPKRSLQRYLNFLIRKSV